MPNARKKSIGSAYPSAKARSAGSAIKASAPKSRIIGPSLCQCRLIFSLRQSKDGMITDEIAAQFRREN